MAVRSFRKPCPRCIISISSSTRTMWLWPKDSRRNRSSTRATARTSAMVVRRSTFIRISPRVSGRPKGTRHLPSPDLGLKPCDGTSLAAPRFAERPGGVDAYGGIARCSHGRSWNGTWGKSLPMAEVKLSYVICTAPRTGSSLFCEALARMDVAGRPAEYFDIHEQNEVYWRKQLEIRDDAEYLDKVLKAGTTSNGVFGLKLHYHQAPALIAKLVADRVARGLPDKARSPHPIDTIDLSLRERLGDVRYIWLRRKNKIAQAISYYLAGKTEQWRVSAGRT